MKRVLIGSVLALLTGGWWWNGGGTYQSREEAGIAKSEWLKNGKNWETGEKRTNQKYNNKSYECTKLWDHEKDIIWRQKGSKLDLMGYRIGGFFGNEVTDECQRSLSLIPSSINKKFFTRKCRYSRDENQFICKERSFQAKDWSGAKNVYFKIKP